jgi:DNA-binding MurR/RpiR family transcriptional regulator
MRLTTKIKKAIDQEINGMASILEEDEMMNWREIVECLNDNQNIFLYGDDDDQEVMDYLVYKVNQYNGEVE